MLEAGSSADRRGIRPGYVWAIGLVALVVISLISVATLVEFGSRTAEMSRLLAAVEASESQMKQTQERMQAVMDEFGGGDITDAERQRITDELTVIARESSTSIAQAGAGVAAVQTLPWHTKSADAQRAYLRHNQAWVDYMVAAAEDPLQWFAPQEEVNDSFADARDPLVRGLMLLDPFDLLVRVEAIYDDGAEGSAGEQA